MITNYYGSIDYTRTEIGRSRLLKTKLDNPCSICKKIIPKGCYAVGNTIWDRICIDCFLHQYMPIFKKSIKEYIRLIGRTEKEILTNIDKITQHNVLKSI